MTTKSEIPIVYITDNNYVEYAGVSITSLFKNKRKETNYKVYVLTVNVFENNINLLKSISPYIEIIPYENKYNNLQLNNKRLTPATFLKADISNIFTNYDKVIYLDCDTTVEKDLTDFFNIDINKFYAGAVKDLWLHDPLYATKLPVKIETYFNAGVMLLNCKKIRQDNIYEKLVSLYNDGELNDLGDQNAFNICFNNHIKVLSPVFNAFSEYIEHFPGFLAKEFETDEKEIIKMKYFPYIIHYTGLLSLYARNYPLSKVWHKYYNNSVFNKKRIFTHHWKVKLKDLLVFSGICNKNFKRKGGQNVH